LVQNTGEIPKGPLELSVYPGPDCKGTLYEDDGHSLDYEKGSFLRVNYSCQVGANAIKIVSAVEKDGYKPWWNTSELTVFGMDKAPREVRVGDSTIHQWRFDILQHAVIFTVPEAKNNWTVEIVF